MKLVLHSINIVRFVMTGVHLQKPLSGSWGASQFSQDRPRHVECLVNKWTGLWGLFTRVNALGK